MRRGLPPVAEDQAPDSAVGGKTASDGADVAVKGAAKARIQAASLGCRLGRQSAGTAVDSPAAQTQRRGIGGSAVVQHLVFEELVVCKRGALAAIWMWQAILG